MVRVLSHLETTLRAMYEDAGLLPKIPGEMIAQASHALPPAEGGPAIAWGSIDTGQVWKLGVVRIRYVRQLMRHRRHSHWAWVAEFAESVVPVRE